MTEAIPAIEARGPTKHYGAVHALDGLDLVAPSGEGHGGARTERGRQDHVREGGRHVAPAGQRDAARGRHRCPRAARAGPADHRSRRPERRRRAGPHRAREPGDGGAPVRSRPPPGSRRGGERARGDEPRRGRRPCGEGLLGRHATGLDLGASLVGSPRLLLLDEPTTGRDPRTSIELWESIRSLVRQGTDVLLTTQYLEEADQLADHVVIIDRGRSIATGTPTELKALAGRDMVEVRVAHGADLATATALLAPLGSEEPRVDEAGRRVAVPVVEGTNRLAHAVRAMSDGGIELDAIGLRRPTLDEVFLTLTGASS